MTWKREILCSEVQVILKYCLNPLLLMDYYTPCRKRMECLLLLCGTEKTDLSTSPGTGLGKNHYTLVGLGMILFLVLNLNPF